MSGTRGGRAVALVLSAVGLVAGAAVAQERPSDRLEWQAAERIELRIAASRALAGADVRVEVTDGVARLQGEVLAPGQTERALRIARRTPGVSEAREELRIAPDREPPASLPDPDVARAVAVRLASDEVLGGEARESWGFGWEVRAPGRSVEVDVDDGDVTLSGAVRLQQSVLDAVRAARSVAGVHSVRTRLRLEVEPPSPDSHFP